MVGEWLLIAEEVEELRESFAAMAVLVFFADGKLGEGFAEWREKENRIVAESCIAARCWQDFAIHAIGHNGERAAAAGERNGTSKMPTAFRTGSAAEVVQQLRDAVGAGRRRACIASGVHPGRSAQSRNDKSGIVCENEAIVKFGIMQRLAGRIFRKRRCSFREAGQRIKLGQRRRFGCEGR